MYSKDVTHTTMIQVVDYLLWVKRIYSSITLSNQVQCQIEQAEVQVEIQSSELNMVTRCLKLQTAELTEN